jgi:adenylate cyclase, class 2
MSRTCVSAEIKARCSDLPEVARRVRAVGGHRVGRVRQVDTFYNVSQGRLKVREADGRAQLIWYFREDALRSKRCDLVILPVSDPTTVKVTLARALGVMVVVHKVRRLYVKQNVRVHLDTVRDLGSFVEIDSLGNAGNFPRLKRQSEEMARALGLRQADLVRVSNSDLLLAKRRRHR